MPNKNAHQPLHQVEKTQKTTTPTINFLHTTGELLLQQSFAYNELRRNTNKASSQTPFDIKLREEVLVSDVSIWELCDFAQYHSLVIGYGYGHKLIKYKATKNMAQPTPAGWWEEQVIPFGGRNNTTQMFGSVIFDTKLSIKASEK